MSAAATPNGTPVEIKPTPRFWRVALGFVLAPLVPAMLFGLLDPGLIGLAAMLAYPSAILFGLPAYIVLRRLLRPRLLAIAVVGGLVAIAPFVVLTIFPSAIEASSNDCVSVKAGHTTLCGTVESVKMMLLIFPLGALGGLVFWLCAVCGDTRLTRAP